MKIAFWETSISELSLQLILLTFCALLVYILSPERAPGTTKSKRTLKSSPLRKKRKGSFVNDYDTPPHRNQLTCPRYCRWTQRTTGCGLGSASFEGKKILHKGWVHAWYMHLFLVLGWEHTHNWYRLLLSTCAGWVIRGMNSRTCFPDNNWHTLTTIHTNNMFCRPSQSCWSKGLRQRLAQRLWRNWSGRLKRLRLRRKTDAVMVVIV